MTTESDEALSLNDQQYAFAAHLRDPQTAPPPPNIEDRRMEIYRELFINNVTSFLSKSFPVLSDLMGESRWQMMIRDFYRDHESRSPLFPDMPKEFLDYLANERSSGKHSDPQEDPAFLFELAHYEWIETGLALAEDPETDSAIDPDGDLLGNVPVTSALAWLYSYNYPVNEIGRDNLPDAPSELPLHYLIHRDSDDKVHFVKLNLVSARLFELVSENGSGTGQDILMAIADELGHKDPAKVVTAGKAILEQWRSKGIVLGSL